MQTNKLVEIEALADDVMRGLLGPHVGKSTKAVIRFYSADDPWCAQCGETFTDDHPDPIEGPGGEMFCDNTCALLYLPKCRRCQDEWRVNDQKLCEDCNSCEHCGETIPGKAFFVWDSESHNGYSWLNPICKRCATECLAMGWWLGGAA